MAYIGKEPGSGLRGRFIYTATAGQTSFTGADSLGRTLTYTDGEYTDVFLNGVKLDKTDYTATSGTSIVLDSGASADDTLEILAFDTFGLFSGEFAQDVSVAGALTVSGTTTTAATTMTGDLSLADKIVHTGDTNTAIRFPAADTVTIETAASERLRVDDSGRVGIATTTVDSNAVLGINGRATFGDQAASGTVGAASLLIGANAFFIQAGENRSSSNAADIRFTNIGGSAERLRIQSGGGISFNGDSAAVNALDDYEEGSWTPTFFVSGASGFAYAIQTGKYVKVGQLCNVSCRIQLSSDGDTDSNSAQVFISSLPFTIGSSGNDFGAMSLGFNTGFFDAPRAGLLFPGTTGIGLYRASSTGGVYGSALEGTKLADTSDIIISATYRTT